MKILLTTDILTHPVSHSPTFHKWLLQLLSAAMIVSEKIKKIDFIDDVLKSKDFPDELLPNNAYTPLTGETKIASSNELKKIFYEYDLIVSFEFSKSTRDWMQSLNIKWISMFIHSARYCEDWLFSVYSNNDQIYSKLKHYNISNHEFECLANYWKVLINERDDKCSIKDNSVLFIGQTEKDMSVWNGRKMLTLQDFDEQIRQIVNTCTHAYFKSHPSGNKETLEYAKKTKLEIINENIYKLLASGKINKVYAISSSVIQEAKFFGIESNYLWEPYFNKDTNYISIGKQLFCSDLWGFIFDDKKINNNQTLFIDDKVAQLRYIRQGHWGYPYLRELTEIPELKQSQTNLIYKIIHICYTTQKKVINHLLKKCKGLLCCSEKSKGET